MTGNFFQNIKYYQKSEVPRRPHLKKLSIMQCN